MTYFWNPRLMGDVFVLPSDIVDKHLRLAGSAQLKILLWCSRHGHGAFDPQACSQALGLSPADCADALQYWLQTGVLLADGQAPSQPAAPEPPAPQETAGALRPAAIVMPPASARPGAVKPQLGEVLERREQSGDFAALLDTVSARLGRPLSHGDMATLLYLFDTAGLPAEVIVMVAVYAVSLGKAKSNMRYIEKVALDWADKGIVTIDTAEKELCRLERRRQATEQVQLAFGLTQSPTMAQSDTAYKWLWEWNLSMDLIRLAGEQGMEKCKGKFNFNYVDKILEHWYADGLTTVELVNQETAPVKSRRPRKTTSFDVDAYDEMALRYTPVYKAES